MDVLSIPQWCDCCEEEVADLRDLCAFNPTMVRLLPAFALPFIVEGRWLSIPQWCDCCRAQLEVFQNLLNSFNPTMVRLLLTAALIEPTEPDYAFNPTMVRLLQFACAV